MVDPSTITTDNDMSELLKERYFDIALKESYPHTPDVTAEMDKIEKAIRKRDGRKQGVPDHR